MIIVTKVGGARILAPAILAVMLSACGGLDGNEVEDQAEVSTQVSELKNGVLVDGSSRWRGVVSLQVYWPDFSAWVPCTGFITSKRTVTTAAHCVSQPLGQYTSGYINVIITRETSPGVWQTLLNNVTVFTKYNPSYNGFATNDVAVITADNQFPYITQSDSLPIAKGSPSGVTMYALGYGYYDTNSYDGQGRSGQITATYGTNPHEYTFSASSSQPWICSGDSGGPIKRLSGVTWMNYGVASWHSGTGNCGSVGHWAPTADNWGWLEYAIHYEDCTESSTAVTCW